MPQSRYKHGANNEKLPNPSKRDLLRAYPTRRPTFLVPLASAQNLAYKKIYCIMARPKGSKNLDPLTKGFVADIEKMLQKADPNIDSLERLACRLMLHDAHQAQETKFFADKGIVTDSRDVIAWGARLKAAEIAANIWRVLMQYKHGQPTEHIDLTVNYTEALTKMRQQRERD